MSNDERDDEVNERQSLPVTTNQGGEGRQTEREKKAWFLAHGDLNMK